MDRLIQTTLRIFSILLAAVLFNGCTHASPRFTLPKEFQEPRITAGGPIQNFADYRIAYEANLKTYKTMVEKTTELPAKVVVRELAQLPSAASRRYAAALATALRRHEVEVAEVPERSAGQPSISYGELAKVSALTELLRGGRDSSAAAMPDDLWMDLLHTIVVYCPADDAAISQTLTILEPFAAEFYRAGPDAQTRREWRVLIQQSLARILDEKRPKNLTTVLPALTLREAGEFIYAYFFTIDNSSGRDATELFAALDRAAAWASRQELPADLKRQAAENANQFAASAPWNNEMKHVDARLLNTRDAATAMKSFCTAINRRDDATVRRYLSDEVLSQPGDLYGKILGASKDHVTFEYVALGFPGNSLEVHCILDGPSGKKNLVMFLPTEPDNGRWRVQSIGPP